MNINTTKRSASHFESVLSAIKSGSGLPFSSLLPRSDIEATLGDIDYRNRVLTPIETVYAFLGQVTSADQSCQNALAQVIAHLEQSQSEQMLSANTSGYCQARQRLPEDVLPSLCRQVGGDMEEAAPDRIKWRGRSVKITDGTTVSMPDTLANQVAYPQQRSQKKGLDSLCCGCWGYSH